MEPATDQLGIVRWAIRTATIVVGMSLVGGLAAAVVGGPLTDLGSGAGGLFGVPSLLLTVAALAIGIPAGVVVARRLRSQGRWIGAAAVVGGGLWIVATGYFMIAHMVDPCVNGWWGPDSRIGSQPLCERFGNELNWHTRFHLLAHSAPAGVLVAMYVWAVRRWTGPADRERTVSSTVGSDGLGGVAERLEM